MNRLAFLAFLFALPLGVTADEKEPTPDELKAALEKALALLMRAGDRINQLEQENASLKTSLAVDRNCS